MASVWYLWGKGVLDSGTECPGWARVLHAAEARGGATELHRMLNTVPTTSFGTTFMTTFKLRNAKCWYKSQTSPNKSTSSSELWKAACKVAHGWHECQPHVHAVYPTDVTTRVEAGLSNAYHFLSTLLGPQDFVQFTTMCTASRLGFENSSCSSLPATVWTCIYIFSKKFRVAEARMNCGSNIRSGACYGMAPAPVTSSRFCAISSGNKLLFLNPMGHPKYI